MGKIMRRALIPIAEKYEKPRGLNYQKLGVKCLRFAFYIGLSYLIAYCIKDVFKLSIIDGMLIAMSSSYLWRLCDSSLFHVEH